MTVNSLIAPWSSSWMKSHPSNFCHRPGLEDQGVIARVVAADLADIPEVLKHHHDRLQDPPQRLAALIRREHDGTAEDDVFAKQGYRGIDVAGFDRATKRVHQLTTSGFSSWLRS